MIDRRLLTRKSGSPNKKRRKPFWAGFSEKKYQFRYERNLRGTKRSVKRLDQPIFQRQRAHCWKNDMAGSRASGSLRFVWFFTYRCAEMFVSMECVDIFYNLTLKCAVYLVRINNTTKFIYIISKSRNKNLHINF